ncbi:hypothetical protein NM688_g6625 [Phlebia brevispora]|uniref:Uncharacterized protein n=1 Tax=Phlebia brevispora TaxID=194682 RepID=A0ACC1SE13_9APHY|nr:hypothetical protein NM688_g6625 [Phlebia brevispora]
MFGSAPSVPPLDGSLAVLPGFVDFHTEHNAERPWAKFSSPTGGEVAAVSFDEFGWATHRVAHLLRPNREGPDGQVVGVLIHCDVLLYVAIIVGIVRAGLVVSIALRLDPVLCAEHLQPFPISDRNSPAAIAHLLKQTSSHRLISQPSLSSLVEATRQNLGSECYALQVDQIPDLYDTFPSIAPGRTVKPVEPYPAVTRPPRTNVVLYLHSSGSTGLPKVVPHTDVTILDWCKTPILGVVRNLGVSWAAMSLPTFHTMGMYAQVYSPLVSGCPVGLYAPQAPLSPIVPTPQNVLETTQKLGCSGIPAVPAFIETWAQSDEDIQTLVSMNLKLMVTGGGPLSPRTGDKLIAAGLKLCSTYGGTEFGTITTVYDGCQSSDPDLKGYKTIVEWEWLSFPSELKHRMAPQGDGMYELQILTSDTHHPCVENMSDPRGYATSDLFEPHPTKPGLWRIDGRKDDVLVLGSGEKIVPLPQEGRITASPMVAAAVMFGRGKSQCGVLIEPRPQFAVNVHDEESVIAFRNEIWPVIEEANATAPTFARIFKEMILIADPARPLPRAAKDTVIRKQSLALYNEEIDALYRTLAESADIKNIPPSPSWLPSDVESWLIRLSTDINRNVPISPTIDVFDQGFDSLHATFLRNRIIATLRNDQEAKAREAAARVSSNLVFDHPTLRELAVALSGIVGSNVAEEKDIAHEILAMIERYSANMPKYNKEPRERADDGVVVLLTGSTGNIGSQLLAVLLSDARIARVYTLNRASSQSCTERQALAFEQRYLPTSVLSSNKVFQLVGDVSVEHFGLHESVYEEISHTVTHVVHNAWKVDFNHSLKSFEPLIAGTRRFVDVCQTFSHPVRFLYTSSISAAAAYDSSLGSVPEEPLSDPHVTAGTGYGASKYVMEQLLDKACDNGLRATSLRIGQVCGSKETGAWSTHEWVAILVKSSISLGALPDLGGAVSWIPVNIVASSIKDLILTQAELPRLVNVVHPRPTPWSSLMENINKYLCLPEGPLPCISLPDWVTRLERLSESVSTEEFDRVPAIKLLDFFRTLAAVGQSRIPSANIEAGGTPPFSTIKLQCFSSTVRDLEPLDEEYPRLWIDFWASKNFIN